jgi:hypothetical protein
MFGHRVGNLVAVGAFGDDDESVLAAQNPSQPGSASGLREIGSGADDMRTAIDGLHRNVDEMSGYLTPLRNFVDTTPDRGANAICSLVLGVVQPVDSVVRSTRIIHRCRQTDDRLEYRHYGVPRPATDPAVDARRAGLG